MKTNRKQSYKKLNALWTAMTVFLCSVLQGYLWSNESESPVEMVVQKNGSSLEISILADKKIDEVELRFHSSRNNKISKETDISIHHPQRIEELEKARKMDHNFWYPVVDMVLKPGFVGIAEFDDGPSKLCLVNGPYWKKKQLMDSTLIIPTEQLEYWENSLRLESPAREMTQFYLSKRLPLVTPKIEHRFELLSDQWSGIVELYADIEGKKQKIAEEEVKSTASSGMPSRSGELTDTDNLLQALQESIDFTLRCQNKNTQSPGFGGLNLFYDLDAQTYRTSYWMWGWGPSVRLLLDASERPEFAGERGKLLTGASEIGSSTLRFLWQDPGSQLDQIMLSRWDRGSNIPEGFNGAITFADSLFLAGWAWIPLYEKLGDERYLDLTRELVQSSDKLMDDFKVLPHSYYIDTDSWSDFTLDECGFGMEGYAEAYRATQNESFRKVGRKFLKQHLDLLEQSEGGWGRSYHRFSDTVNPTTNHTRGQGWAMEGLLAAHRLLPDEGHLERCRRMAEKLLESQLDSGCWAWRFDQSVEEVGVSEKGTALWSYLLYRLYYHTGEKRYLESARKALGWCFRNQYDGPDLEAQGSIPGRTKQSAVGYRQWFDISCVYTSAFFGLAIMEELKLQSLKIY